VTVLGQVNHLGTAWAIPLWVGIPAKAGEVNRHITRYTSPYPWSHNVGWYLAEGLVQWR